MAPIDFIDHRRPPAVLTPCQAVEEFLRHAATIFGRRPQRPVNTPFGPLFPVGFRRSAFTLVDVTG